MMYFPHRLTSMLTQLDYGTQIIGFKVSFKQGNDYYETPLVSKTFSVVSGPGQSYQSSGSSSSSSGSNGASQTPSLVTCLTSIILIIVVIVVGCTVLYTVEKTAEGIMSKDVIVTQNVSKTYGKPPLQVFALRETNLQIEQGDYIAIIGPSGSGKSTLMNLLGCLDKPTTGNIFIDGKDVSTLNENELARIRREKIGFIFQKYNLIPTLNALENVELSMGFAGVDSQTRTAKAKQLLELVELSKRLTHKPSEMSGGEQQRVAIARALANNPSIILADEPTGNVDTKSGENIMNILEEVNRKGETIIVVTHNMAIAQRAKRVLRIQDGVVKEEHV